MRGQQDEPDLPGVPDRAKGFGMRVVASDPFVSAERYKDLGVEKAESSDGVYAEADFLTLHLPKTPDTEGWLDAEALAKCKDGVRVLNVARGPLIVDACLRIGYTTILLGTLGYARMTAAGAAAQMASGATSVSVLYSVIFSPKPC